MKTTKQFPTLAVAGVATGVCLEKGGMVGIQAVMDHLFPGIFTLGIAAMQPTASEEIYRQLPELKAYISGFGDFDFQEHHRTVASGVRSLFGETLPVEGPMEVSQEKIDEAFQSLK